MEHPFPLPYSSRGLPLTKGSTPAKPKPKDRRVVPDKPFSVSSSPTFSIFSSTRSFPIIQKDKIQCIYPASMATAAVDSLVEIIATLLKNLKFVLTTLAKIETTGQQQTSPPHTAAQQASFSHTTTFQPQSTISQMAPSHQAVWFHLTILFQSFQSTATSQQMLSSVAGPALPDQMIDRNE